MIFYRNLSSIVGSTSIAEIAYYFNSFTPILSPTITYAIVFVGCGSLFDVT